MNGKTVKRLRKKLKSEEVLLLLVKEYGDKTKNMNERQVYQKVKKLYKQGKIKL